MHNHRACAVHGYQTFTESPKLSAVASAPWGSWATVGRHVHLAVYQRMSPQSCITWYVPPRTSVPMHEGLLSASDNDTTTTMTMHSPENLRTVPAWLITRLTFWLANSIKLIK